MLCLLGIAWLGSCTRAVAFSQEHNQGLVKVSADGLAVGEVKKEIFRRMRSGEIKDRAWGVYLIGQHGLGEFATGVSELLRPALEGESRETSLFYQVVLDSLIQLDAAVPADVLMPHYKKFPEQVLILLAKRPEANREVLVALLKELHSGIFWISVCNLLTPMKAPGFAAHLLGDMTIRISVRVYDEYGGSSGGVGGGWGCGVRGVSPDPVEFPPIARYVLTSHTQSDAVLLAPGRRATYYVRYSGQPGMPYTGEYTRCEGGGHEDQTRTEYLAELLDTAMKDLQFTPRPSYHVLWNGLETYQYEIARIRAEVEGSLGRLVEGLVVKRLLSVSEAVALKVGLFMDIIDDRADTSIPLPDMYKNEGP
jgi:hypothetical protein